MSGLVIWVLWANDDVVVMEVVRVSCNGVGGSEGDRSGSGGRGPKEEGAGSVASIRAGSVASITESMSFMRWVCSVESVEQQSPIGFQ